MGFLEDQPTGSGSGSSQQEEGACATNNGAASLSVSRKLDRIIRANDGYRFTQQNGQRIFEPRNERNVPPPPKGCEIFIGNIPKHVFEDELIPLFQRVGPLYKFRLMLDFSQRTRGYGFATYFHPHHVNKAIEAFDGYEIAAGVTLGIYKSIDNRRLFVGNIPRNKTNEDVYRLFNNLVEGLVKVIMYSSWKDKDLNRGFAFLEFESHIQASVARRHLHPRNLVIWEHCLYVDWADPVPEVNPEIMAKVSVLYVKNLPHDLDGEQTKILFQNTVGRAFIKKTHKILTYAFVHCKNRRSAEIAMEKLQGFTFGGQEIEVEWARPRQYSSQWRALHPPENFCLSVPLRTRRAVREMAQSRKNPSSATSEAGNQNNFADQNGENE